MIEVAHSECTHARSPLDMHWLLALWYARTRCSPVLDVGLQQQAVHLGVDVLNGNLEAVEAAGLHSQVVGRLESLVGARVCTRLRVPTTSGCTGTLAQPWCCGPLPAITGRACCRRAHAAQTVKLAYPAA